MSAAKRRKRGRSSSEKFRGSHAECVARLVEQVLRNLDPLEPHVVLGPVAWILPEGSDLRRWYFFAAGGKYNSAFWMDIIQGCDEKETNDLRNAAYFELMMRKPIVIHDFDDEYEMVKFAAAAWPCERTAKMLAAVEAEERAR